MRASEARLLGHTAGCLLALVVLVSCSQGNGLTPAPTPVPTPQASVSVPSDGRTLAAFGFTHGPVEEFSLPRTASLVSRVDQPNNVTAIISSPSPAQIADYLRRSLPAAGFVITRDDAAVTTLTFEGHGWSGSFTGGGLEGAAATSAVLLRPG
jgi:hypothetical protein